MPNGWGVNPFEEKKPPKPPVATARVTAPFAIPEVPIGEVRLATAEEISRQAAIEAGESHYWVEAERIWKPVAEKPEVPLSRIPFAEQIEPLGEVTPFKQIREALTGPEAEAVKQVLGFVGLVGSLGLVGWQGVGAIRSMTEWRRLPQYKALIEYAKANNIPRSSKVFKDAQTSLRSAINLKRGGAHEAADEIMARFNATYAKGMPEIQAETPAAQAQIARFAPAIVPEGKPPAVTPIPTIQNLIDANYTPNVAATLGGLTRNMPVAGSLLKAINPMIGAKTNAEKAVIAWMGLHDVSPSFAQIEMNPVYANDQPFEIALKETQFSLKRFELVTGLKKGEVLDVKPVVGKGVERPHILQVLERPDDYILTESQRAEVDLLDRILQQQLEKELTAGVDVKQVKLAPGQRYFPRFVKEIQDLETKALLDIKRGTGRRPGIRPSSFRERYYEEVLDGIVKGKIYSADYRAAVNVRLTAGNKAIADKMLEEYLKPLGRLPRETIALDMRLAKEEIINRRAALKQISELIEHINAKEKINWYRWLGIKKLYLEQYAELRAIAKAKTPVTAELKKFIVAEKKTLTATSKEVLARYRVEMKRAKKPILGKEGSINHASLQGRLFPVDIAEPTNDLIRGAITPQQVLNQLAKISDTARMGQTAIDMGPALIQGQLILFNNPKAWGKMWEISLKTLWNPKYRARYGLMNRETEETIATHGGAPFGGSEFTLAARPGGWLSAIPGFERFGKFFESLIDTGRIEQVKSQLPHYISKQGRELTEAELTDLVVSIDHMVGIGSLRRLGVDNFLSSLGRNVMYAPRYYLAFVSFLGRSFQGGIGGDLARKSLTRWLFGAACFMSALAVGLGQKERIIPTKDKPIPTMFDPRKGEFMTVEIEGTHIGLGGVWVAGLRLLGSLVRTAEDDPEDFISIDPHENPLLRYGYGRASPVASAAIDIATGKNYLGERLDTPDDYLKEIIDKTFPFWLAGQITDVPKAGWEKAAAEWWGLRAWMVQYREEARRHAEEHIKDIPQDMIMDWQRDKIADDRPLRYEDLNNEQRGWLLLNFEDFREAEEKRKGQKLERGTDFEVADIKTREILDTAYEVDLTEIAEGVLSGMATILNYMEQTEYLRRIRSGGYQYRETIMQFIDEERWEDVEKWVEENKKPEDEAYDNYMELRGSPPKVAGVPDWDAWKENLDNFLQGLSPEVREYILRRRDDWISNLPESAQKIEQLILECEEVLDAYYELPEGEARYQYRDTNPNVDARLIIIRGLKPRTGAQEAVNLLAKYGIPEEAVPNLEVEVKPLRPKLQPQPTVPSGWGANPFG